MRTPPLVAIGAVLAALSVSGGLAAAAPPDEPTAKIEAAAEAAMEAWITTVGGHVFTGTVACGIDAVSSHSAYCYAHTDTGIVAASSPIPDPPGSEWQFTLLAGSIGTDGNVAIPTTVPQQPQPTVVAPPLTTVPTPTVAEPAPSTSATATTFGEGMQLVNVDVAPGRYQAAGSDFCYWERRSAADDEMDSIISNAIILGPAVADIVATDVAFSSQGCGTWTPYVAPPAPATTFGPGAYVVGSDIAPGTYEASGGADCYWRRLGGFTADLEDILAIENMTQPGSVVIEATDVGFESAECGTWTLISGDSLTG